MSTTATIINRKNGKVAFKIYSIFSPLILCIINKENPTGGVICDNSTINTKNIPNHKGSNPAKITIGNTIGKVITTIEIPSKIIPKNTYIIPMIIINSKGDNPNVPINSLIARAIPKNPTTCDKNPAPTIIKLTMQPLSHRDRRRLRT